MSQTDTSSIIPVVLPTEETGKESERGVQGGSNAPDERNERDQQQAAGTAARARSSEPGGGPCSSSSQPSPEEWADHCRTTWPNWNADDIARAYHSAAAAGWRKSRGGRIRDWRAFSVVCAKVWEASREGQEAARRAKEREKEQERRAESLRRLEAARTPASSLTPEEREANRAALLQGLFGKRAA